MKCARTGSPSFALALALAVLAAPSVAAAQVDPARAFYAVAFTHGSPHNGVITAQDTDAPFGVLASATRGTLNGAIALDPVRGVLYGSACCAASQAIQAYEPVGLTRFAARDIPVTSSGSLAIEVDAPRRVLFFYDTVTRVLRALSLTDGAQYGGVVAMLTLTDLPAEPVATSAGDQLAVDTRGQQLFVTGGDGGPVLAVDVSRVTESGGAFGAVTDTGHRNRATGNSGGGVAVDEAGRRVFFFPTTGAVRIVGADAPYAVLGEVAIPAMAANDCGLMFDGRTSRLYVGRGASAPPVAVSFPSMAVAAFATGPGEVPALSFAGAGTACVDRDADGFFPALCAPTGARVDCDDARSERNPGAVETCDGADNDCDGLVDEGFCRIDGACFTDGQANPANACEACAASATASGPTAWRPGARGAVCRAAAGDCDAAETCDGESVTCPADGRRPAGEVCRATATIAACDPAEACDGVAAACPTDVVTRAPTTETCNGADDDCDGMIDELQCTPADAGVADAGVTDVGAADTGPADVGVDVGAADVGGADTEVTDAGADVGVVDAGVVDVDAGVVDAGIVDAGVSADVGSMALDTGAGEITAPQTDGCGCAVPGRGGLRGGRWVLAVGVAVALTARRRRPAGPTVRSAPRR